MLFHFMFGEKLNLSRLEGERTYLYIAYNYHRKLQLRHPTLLNLAPTI